MILICLNKKQERVTVPFLFPLATPTYRQMAAGVNHPPYECARICNTIVGTDVLDCPKCLKQIPRSHTRHVSLRLGHKTALTFPECYSLPFCRFATLYTKEPCNAKFKMKAFSSGEGGPLGVLKPLFSRLGVLVSGG